MNNISYENERQVYYKIDSSKIKGILLREIDAKKRLSEISFNYKFTDKSYFENKVFTTISFFKDYFKTFGNTDKIYFLIGKLREAQICDMPDEIIMELISREVKNNINYVLSSVLKINNPTILEVISFFNNNKYPIYIMNRFDIQVAGNKLLETDYRIERFRETTNSTISEIKCKKTLDKKTLKLLKKMSDSGLDIYYGYTLGPLSNKDTEIVEEIKKLSLKK